MDFFTVPTLTFGVLQLLLRGREGIRTTNPLLAKQVLNLLQSNRPTGFGSHIVSEFFDLQMAYESSPL